MIIVHNMFFVIYVLTRINVYSLHGKKILLYNLVLRYVYLLLYRIEISPYAGKISRFTWYDRFKICYYNNLSYDFCAHAAVSHLFSFERFKGAFNDRQRSSYSVCIQCSDISISLKIMYRVSTPLYVLSAGSYYETI